MYNLHTLWKNAVKHVFSTMNKALDLTYKQVKNVEL